MEQVVLMINTNLIEPHHLPFNKQLAALDQPCLDVDVLQEQAPAKAPRQLNIADMERRMVASALESTQGNVTRAAALLGLTRDKLRYRIEKYHIKKTHQKSVLE